jgi:hypothetical protein
VSFQPPIAIHHVQPQPPTLQVPFRVERWNRALNMGTNAFLSEYHTTRLALEKVITSEEKKEIYEEPQSYAPSALRKSDGTLSSSSSVSTSPRPLLTSSSTPPRVLLTGLRDFPTKESRLDFDLSGLLGVLFFLWLFQLPVPGNVHALVFEKSVGLRVAMKQAGLSDVMYYSGTYFIQYSLYTLYAGVAVAAGLALELSVFTKTEFTLLVVTLSAWGHVMTAWVQFLSAVARQATTTVLLFLVWMFASAFIAEFVFQQFLVNGPGWTILVFELHPTFSLYRTLWEISQVRQGNHIIRAPHPY